MRSDTEQSAAAAGQEVQVYVGDGESVLTEGETSGCFAAVRKLPQFKC